MKAFESNLLYEIYASSCKDFAEDPQSLSKMTPQLLALALLLLAVSVSAEVVQLTSKTFAAVNKEGDWRE